MIKTFHSVDEKHKTWHSVMHGTALLRMGQCQEVSIAMLTSCFCGWYIVSHPSTIYPTWINSIKTLI